MKRRPGAFAIICFVVFLATLAIGARSFFVYDSISRSHSTFVQPNMRSGGFNVESWRGRLTLSIGELIEPATSSPRHPDETIWFFDHHGRWEDGYEPGGLAAFEGFLGRLGFAYRVVGPLTTSGGTSRERWITFPLWPLLLITAIPPALWLRRRRRLRFRTRNNLCIHCDYDLRGSSDRCPECGVAVA